MPSIVKTAPLVMLLLGAERAEAQQAPRPGSVATGAVDTAGRPNAVAPHPPSPVALTPAGGQRPSRFAPPGSENSRETHRGFKLANTLVTVGGSLAIVLGLFFLSAWLMRRGLPAGAQHLPNDVVEVLGRIPLPGRQQAHLLRCGNKLVLVSFSSAGADTLTEVTDPLEVDRLAGLCRRVHPHSATTAFRQVLQQFSREKPAPGFLEPAPDDGPKAVDSDRLLAGDELQEQHDA